MIDEQRLKKVIKDLEDLGVCDVQISATSDGNDVIKRYETVLEVLKKSDEKFGTLDDVDRMMESL